MCVCLSVFISSLLSLVQHIEGTVAGRNGDWKDEDDHDDDHDDDNQSNIETAFDETHAMLPQCGEAASPQHEEQATKTKSQLQQNNHIYWTVGA